MKRLAVVALSMLIAACASAPPTPVPRQLFDDRLFGPPSERISADDVFALSDAMRAYVDTEIARQVAAKGRQQALFDALYARNELRLEYDSARTRTAAQAFAARSGNCLSLVIMTAAFAKELGLTIHFQSAYAEESWGRDDDTHYFIGHVNLVLGRRPLDQRFQTKDNDRMTIDFLPPMEVRALRTREVPEKTIVAMYMNNRAAEALADRRLDDAYAWARAAIEQDPDFASSYNTLGVVYQRHGDLEQARGVLAFALAREPSNTRVMSNLAAVLTAQERPQEAAALAQKLERMEPDPPFAYFYRGVKAMTVRDYRAAKDLFAKEVDRAPYNHEFHFWLAAAYVGLGDTERAREHLTLAIEYSPTRTDRDLYAAKLERITSKR
jgi:Tfp pilus assembly protein PilF